jgi:ArsR family metal-binding transcriptional regulator
VVPDAKSGDRVPAESAKADSEASDEALADARVTTMVYVRVLLPSAAVTTTDRVFAPTASAIDAVLPPLATMLPLTLTMASTSALVGVSVIVLTLLATASV